MHYQLLLPHASWESGFHGSFPSTDVQDEPSM